MDAAKPLSAVSGAIRATAVPDRSAGSLPAKAAATTSVITISRQAGINAGAIAGLTAQLLNKQAGGSKPWKSYDRQLINRVARDHHLSEEFVASHDEHDESLVEHAIHGLGSGKPAEAMPLKVTATVRHLAEEGRAIIVGRGGQYILANRDDAVHVRLIAPEGWRAAIYGKAAGLKDAEALKALRRFDADRARYLKAHFNHDPADPLLYDLILNVESVGAEPMARAIAALVS